MILCNDRIKKFLLVYYSFWIVVSLCNKVDFIFLQLLKCFFLYILAYELSNFILLLSNFILLLNNCCFIQQSWFSLTNISNINLFLLVYFSYSIVCSIVCFSPCRSISFCFYSSCSLLYIFSLYSSCWTVVSDFLLLICCCCFYNLAFELLLFSISDVELMSFLTVNPLTRGIGIVCPRKVWRLITWRKLQGRQFLTSCVPYPFKININPLTRSSKTPPTSRHRA